MPGAFQTHFWYWAHFSSGILRSLIFTSLFYKFPTILSNCVYNVGLFVLFCSNFTVFFTIFFNFFIFFLNLHRDLLEIDLLSINWAGSDWFFNWTSWWSWFKAIYADWSPGRQFSVLRNVSRVSLVKCNKRSLISLYQQTRNPLHSNSILNSLNPFNLAECKLDQTTRLNS